MAQAQEALEAADTTTGVMDAYAAAPPTIKAQMAGQISSRVNGVMAAETQSLQEETPPLEAKLSHEIPPGAGTLEVPSPDAVPVNVETQPPAPAPELDLPPVPEPGHFQANDDILAAVTRAQPAEDDRARQVSGALEDVQTSDPGIPIRPSETPSVPLEGETDPERLHNQLEEGKTQGRDHLAAAQAGVLNGPGPEQVQPISVDESHPVENLTVPTAAEIAAPEGADAYLAMNLPPEVQVAFDQNNGAEMQASVAGAQTQIAQATETRDQQHQAEVQNAQQQNQALVQEADQNQRDRVGEARAQIQSERQRTLDEQNAAVQSVESEASERQNQDRAEIDGRVQRDEEAVQQRYDQTERDAQAEIESGERRAEERQRQAERDAENQSWWERAVNFVRDAFNALVSAINSIFDAVRAAVNVLLDAARDFAIGLINAVSSFIQSAIAAFGAFLTGLVQALLSDIFPELAARLTAAINAAVTAAQQAVEAVAEGLRQGVNALVEGLRAAINAVLDAYQAAINTALAVLEAALTGDWGALARRILESVLSLLGIDPQAFYAFIGQVLDTIQLIIDDPGGFLGNVLGAVVGGIQNFATNFLQHLQAGIIGWLTGALGSAGITLPESFDLMGVLSLVQQILGLTWENIRERAVRLVGERGVQVLEFIGSYIETLITSGWAGLWERIQSDLATLRDMVLEQIRNFLVERVILAAIQWLAAFNPIGGIVRIVMTIYNFIMFLRDQLQRLFALAQTVIGALSDIARGNLAPAMQAVEGVLAGLLPVVIDLLARILGLGNVGGRVREIMQSIQDTLWGAIDRLLDRVLASFRGGGDAVAGAEGAGPEEQAEPGTEADTRRFTLPLNFPGESHTVTVTVDRGDVTASIASRRQGLLFDVLSAAITEIEERDRRYPRNANPALLRQLYEARREISDEAIMQEFTTRGRPGYRPSSGPPESSPAFIEFVEVRLNELINLMRVAFENDRVHTLDQVFATDELTGPRFLPVQTRGSRWIRPNLYEGFRSWQSFRDPIVAAEVRRITTDVRTAKTTNDYSIWNRLDAAHQLPRNAQLATFQPADVANVEYHLDHIQPVARHWNTAGNNTDDSARDTFYFDPNNLRVVTQEFNLSRGSENENYVNFVETNFTSRLAEANIRSAREILDGGTPRRFLDDRGSPIP